MYSKETKKKGKNWSSKTYILFIRKIALVLWQKEIFQRVSDLDQLW